MEVKKKKGKKKLTKKKGSKKLQKNISDKELLNMVDENKLGKGANVSNKSSMRTRKMK